MQGRGLTVGFSGSGGAGKTPLPKNDFAGSRRILGAAKPLSAANDVCDLFARNHLQRWGMGGEGR
jgi:hypothetical protein